MKIATFPLLILLATCLVISPAGCESYHLARPHEGAVDLLPLEAYPRIVVEHGLHKLLVFGDPVVDVASDMRPMKVAVPVRIKSYRAGANLQYQYVFVDEHGRSVSESGWRFERLPPRWRRDLTAAALDTDAVDFRLEVRRSR